LNTLVDTSVWSLSLRREPADLNPSQRLIVRELTELIAEGRAFLIGPIRQEILSGIRSPSQFESLRLFLRDFPDVQLAASDYESAAMASNKCKGKGLIVSVVDALICAVALDRDFTIFSIDRDFERFTDILNIELHSPRK